MKILVNFDRKSILVFLLALNPFLINYDIPFTGVNVTVLLFLTIFLLEVFEQLYGMRKNGIRGCYIMPMFIWMAFYVPLGYIFVSLFEIADLHLLSGFVGITLFFVELYGIISFFSDDIVLKKYRKHLENITLVMSFCIFWEYFVYYGFGVLPGGENRQLLLPFHNLYRPSVDISLIVSESGLFRPSAFFLEPAHFSSYCCLGLVSLLFHGKDKIGWRPILVSIAIVLTTSGIGIGVVLVIWGFLCWYSISELSKRRLIQMLFIILTLSFFFTCLYSFFPFFQQAIARVSGVGTDNAISGRLGNYVFIKNLNGAAKFFGMGYLNLPTYGENHNTYYFTSILEMAYCQGYMGTIVFLGLYGIALIKAFADHNKMSLLVMIIGLAYFIGSSFLSPSGLLGYIPFMYASCLAKKDKKIPLTNSNYFSGKSGVYYEIN